MPDMNVAVIGMGPAGIVSLKNLREAGLNAIGFDGNTYLGGLWRHAEGGDKVSVLSTTVTNTSKYTGCFTDFPFGTDIPDFPTAHQQAQYLEEYAKHFDLVPYIRLGTRVVRVERTKDAWKLEILVSDSDSTESITFDKIVVTCGITVGKPIMPTIKGLSTFPGKTIHSAAYRSAKDYHGARVIVAGLGNTGADVAVDLMGHAESVYLSYSGEGVILPRARPGGAPLDSRMSIRFLKLLSFLETNAPRLGDRFSSMALQKLQAESFGSEPIPGQPSKVPALGRKYPIINDELVPALRSKRISTRPRIASIDGSSVTFTDGTVLQDVDAIIFCTGYTPDFDFLGPDADPTTRSTGEWDNVPGSEGRPLPRLYRSIFSEEFPESLAFVGYSPLGPQAWMNFDISAMSIAQIWAGKSPLPSKERMTQHIESQHQQALAYARTGRVARVEMCDKLDWLTWCDEVSGSGVLKRTGHGVAGWKFWYYERPLYDLVVGGVMSPHLFRIFDEGKREAWSGASDELRRVNAHYKRLLDQGSKQHIS